MRPCARAQATGYFESKLRPRAANGEHMSKSYGTLATLTLVLGACAGGGPPSPDGGLAFAMPKPPSATYVTSDTLERT